jgi:hypothetical protein
MRGAVTRSRAGVLRQYAGEGARMTHAHRDSEG